MDDLLREFLAESNELLLRIEQQLVDLEQHPDDENLLGSIFRSMHTIKGTCGFVGLARLGAVAHSAESVLGAVRDGELELTDAVASDVLAAVDVIRDILAALDATGEEPEGTDTDLIERLDAWLQDGPAKGRGAAGARASKAGAGKKGSAKKGAAKKSTAEKSTAKASASTKAASKKGSAKKSAAKAGSANGSAPKAPAAKKSAAKASASKARAGKVSEPEATAGERAGEAPAEADAGTTEPTDRSGPRLADASLRVNLEVLDQLMNLAGELVLTRNQLMQLGQAEEDAAYLTPVQQLDRVTTDLQEAVMQTRMQPVGNAWGKLPRLIRDLSHASGKQIDLTMLGSETELDRQILQAIQDPLTHMVRNSADHGIEAPAVRAAAGKPERGSIVVEAFHEGGHIVIEIRDDGRGLDVEAISGKIVERGLLSAEEVAQLPRHRVFEFIFAPGFSTAKEVTSVSGRGVGMDVVKRNIEKIGGTILVNSTRNEGSTFRIKIPLTLAIMSALIVGVRGQSFAVPQIGVLELVRVADGNRHLVEEINGALFYRLRDALLPLVRLDAALGLQAQDSGAPANIVVCQVGTSRFGLMVDAILDTHEIVVKPVGRKVKSIREYAGTTILGDGRVIMILDVPGLAEESGVLSQGQGQAAVQHEPEDVAGGVGTELLLFDAGVEAPRAVPLSQVSRLEKVDVDDIEWVDHRWVVQYRGRLLPLIPGSERIEMRAKNPRHVVVFSDGELALGLAVDSISDIVREIVEIEARSETPGLVGSAVVAGRTTELVDIDFYLARAHAGEWSLPSHEAPRTNGKLAARQAQSVADAANTGETTDDLPRVLVIDDSPFFLTLLVPVLEAGGFHVTPSTDGRQALSRMNEGEAFDVIVSDIDMPNMDGFEFTRLVRDGSDWEHTPVLALTSRYSDADRRLGAEVGFDRYLMKFDQDEVLAAVRDVVHGTENPREAQREEVPV